MLLNVDMSEKGGHKMRCPYCENEDSKVIDSRHTEDGRAIRLSLIHIYYDICDSHERHYDRSNACDPLQSADNYKCCEKCHYDRCDNSRYRILRSK